MKAIANFTVSILLVVSIIIISMIDNTEEELEFFPAAEQIRDKGYNVYRFDRGYCADRAVRGYYNYIATYCNGEHGKISTNVPHTSTVHWDEVYSNMIKEVDSLSARFITHYQWTE